MGFEFSLGLIEEFKLTMNVNLTPHYFIFDGEQNLIWQKVGFLQGDEVEIQEVLESMAKK
jgi:hypothetical protein